VSVEAQIVGEAPPFAVEAQPADARRVATTLRVASEPGVADPEWSPAPRGWYASLLAGSLPLFALGMLASALADRLDFAGWAIVAGAGHALLLRAAWVRGWSVPARTALVLGWSALALVAFATLVARHQEVLDLGYRALLWPVYLPLLTRPLTVRVVAGALMLSALAALVFARATRRAGGAS
jgi:hypothetical protein